MREPPAGAAAKRPNFFLAGAAKSGTTALAVALGGNQDVYMPRLKEPHLYAHLADPAMGLYADEATARKRYSEHYAGVAGEAAIGDASTTSLVVPGAAAVIADEVPSARIVVILRQPVDRAYSHFCHFVAAGGERTTSFAEALRLEDQRQAEGFPFIYRYRAWSRYSEQLPPFFQHFGRDRILVHLYDDLRRNPEGVVRATFAFLEVDDRGVLAPLGEHNEVRAPRFVPLRRALNGGPARRAMRHHLATSPVWRPLVRMGSTLVRPKPPLDPDLRAELTEGFRDEILRLEDLIGRDLAAWR